MTAYALGLNASAEIGSRHASRVRIINTPDQPTVFAGQTGTVVRVHHEGAVVVRLPAGELPFGRSQMEVVKR